MLRCALHLGYTKAISASTLLPFRSHSASLRNGENPQKTAEWAAKDNALALPMSLIFKSRSRLFHTNLSAFSTYIFHFGSNSI